MSVIAMGLTVYGFMMLALAVISMPIKPIKEVWEKILKNKTKWLKPLIIVIIFVIAFSGYGQTLPDTLESPQNDITSSQTETNNSEDNTNTTDTTNKEESGKPTESQKTETSKIDISSIPEYNGKPYIAINNNIPLFSSAELTTKGYEKYNKLDNLGRVQVCIASVGKDTMPKPNEERGNISNIKPTGWIQAKYDCVSGGWLYNRCHLIGWQLSAENANKRNLITGTKYLNTEGMLPFENMVADYIKETGNHVAYRITPIYQGNNLLPSGVQMEAKSVEDNGEGICFNVYCYNVQPNIKINYADGSSSLANGSSNTTDTTSNEESSKPTESQKPETSKPAHSHSYSNANCITPATCSCGATNGSALGHSFSNGSCSRCGANDPNFVKKTTYILSMDTMKFHYESCRWVSKIKPENKGTHTGHRDNLIAQGYSPCGTCDP